MENTRVIVSKFGGPEVLKIIREPLRMPQKNEIRVKVLSSGVALGDVMRREGVFPFPPTLPFTPGYDAIGIVDEPGSDVNQLSKGDKVAVFFNGTGGYATYVYAKEDEVTAIPADIDPVLGVAVTLNYVTAYQMLHRFAKVSEGDRILIHGASGGTGTALLELGKLAKLKMFGTASSAKHEIVLKYGAVPIDYREEDFVQVLRNQAPEGMDAVFDPIGGENYNRSLQTLNENGRCIVYGYTSVLEKRNSSNWSNEWKQIAENEKAQGGNPQSLYTITGLKKERLDWFREDLQIVFSLLKEGKIKPIIAEKMPLTEAARAQQLLEKSKAIGKVVLTNES
ncbi:medium chain dehydrogenase/reductase family protein [Bacillus gobiensis]|uniref:medium chain dehydrogenase/reductase family protein n=1 Tax=Bacillus gobiensis TaxID=1441095 RepID=UPI003D222D68